MRVTCRKMGARDAKTAEALLGAFLREDEHYLANSAIYGDKGPHALRAALRLFLRRPRLGFVWLAFVDGAPAGVCVIAYAISTSIGGVVAKLDDVFVVEEFRRRGVGRAMMLALQRRLRSENVLRIDTSVYRKNRAAAGFYRALQFGWLGEERLSLILS